MPALLIGPRYFRGEVEFGTIAQVVYVRISRLRCLTQTFPRFSRKLCCMHYTPKRTRRLSADVHFHAL